MVMPGIESRNQGGREHATQPDPGAGGLTNLDLYYPNVQGGIWWQMFQKMALIEGVARASGVEGPNIDPFLGGVKRPSKCFRCNGRPRTSPRNAALGSEFSATKPD
jgi:hypothetical protein